MKREAEANADADKAAKEKVEKLNEADSLIFQTERQLGEYADKIPAEGKSKIEKALAELKQIHQRQDTEAIDKAIADLNAAWYEVTQNMGGADFGSQNPNAEAPNQNPNPSQTESDFADFEEVKK
jgi:molecular chaperone DnaK